MPSSADGVVLLHGLGRTARSMRPIERHFAGAGLRTLRIDYPSRSLALEPIVAKVAVEIDRWNADAGGKMHFVTHSFGGIVTRALLAGRRPENLGRVVMLAPPWHGSEWADLAVRIRLAGLLLGPVASELTTGRDGMATPVDYPLGIIAGNRALDPIFPRLVVARPNDGKVSVASTCAPGMTDHIVMPVSHTLMTSNARVGCQALAFVRDGRFARMTLDGAPHRT